MVSINNELSYQSPIPESILEEEAVKAFEAHADHVPEGIQAYLAALTSKSDAEGYKFVVSVSSIDAATRGPVKTYTGAFWNAQQDGSWSTYLGKLHLLITLTWIHV